jgi:multiple sugar transport system substrate-binding protein
MALAAACTPGGGAGDASVPRSKEPATLHFMTQGAQPPNEWDSIVEPYKARAPHVTVHVDIAGGGDDFTEKGLSLGAAGTPPSVSWCSTRFAFPFAKPGLVLDIQEQVKRAKLDVRDIPKLVYEEPIYQGRMYQLTSDVGYAMFAFNKTMLAQTGRRDPWQHWEQRQWNWERYVGEAQAIQQALGGQAAGRYGAVVSTWDGEVFTIVRSNGADVLDKDNRRLTLDQPAALQALEDWVGLVQRHNVAPPPGTAGQTFASGQVASEFYAQARIGRTRQDAQRNGFAFDVAPPPAHKSMVPTMFSNGYHLWKGKTEAEAWAFIAFAVSPEGLLSRGKLTGRVPSRLSLLEEFAKTLDIPAQDPKSFVKLYPDLAKVGRGLPYTSNFTVWRNLLEQQVLQPALKGEKTVREAVTQATSPINAELAKG